MSSTAARPPASLDELRGMIVRREIRMSRQLEAVLRHVIGNPMDAAFGTCRSIAERCNVSAATVDRLAATLGFDGFADFRDLFRRSLRAAADKPDPSTATPKDDA